MEDRESGIANRKIRSGLVDNGPITTNGNQLSFVEAPRFPMPNFPKPDYVAFRLAIRSCNHVRGRMNSGVNM